MARRGRRTRSAPGVDRDLAVLCHRAAQSQAKVRAVKCLGVEPFRSRSKIIMLSSRTPRGYWSFSACLQVPARIAKLRRQMKLDPGPQSTSSLRSGRQSGAFDRVRHPANVARYRSPVPKWRRLGRPGMVKMGWSTKYYSCGGPLQVAHTGTTLYFGSSRVKAHSGCLDYRLAGLTPADLVDHGQLLTAAHPGPGAY